MTKSRSSRFKLPLDEWNVYFLLAKKLKQKAALVEAILANTVGTPNALKVNRILKSISVLALPTIANRNFSALFLIATFVIFLNKIKWPALGLIENTADIFTHNPKRKQLDTAQE